METPLISTLVNAFNILDVVSLKNDRGMTITEISDALSLHKSTVLRLLNTLEALDCVQRGPDNQRYTLGVHLFRLGWAVTDSMELRTVARPFMEKLGEKTKEAVHLGVWDKGEVIYIDKIESQESIQIRSRIGRAVPAYCTGIGKLLLAYLADDKLEDYLDKTKLKPLTAGTITSRAELERQLRCIRENKNAEDNEEHEEGVCCVAAPIFNYANETIAAISITIPSLRFNAERKKELTNLVMKAASAISMQMGCPV